MNAPLPPQALAGSALAGPVLSVRGLTKVFPGREVLRGLDFALPPGQATALIGANGSGKSTLLRCLVRLVEPTSGQVHLLGRDVTALPPRALRHLRAEVGIVWQCHNLVPRLSALSNVIHGVQARMSGLRTWAQALAPAPVCDEAMACLDRVGLADRALVRVDCLSGGQQQRVAIARMLMQRPRLILADEPDASLDPQTGEEVMSLLLGLVRDDGLSLLVISHRLEHTLHFSDRILGLANGRIALDTATARANATGLRQFFDKAATPLAPARYQHRSLVDYAVILAVLALVVTSLAATAPAPDWIGSGIARLFAPSGMLTQMAPPDFTRIVPIGWRLLETLQMAVAGCVLGLILALPFAILSTDRLSPHPLVRHAARALVALLRTVPDLVWAIIFIIVVGLGPAAGVMAIMVDKIGFAGRFFAEAMEETDPGPQDALRAIGASRLGIIGSAVIPACLSSFTATSLFALEKSVRGSAALGLVGAGGIGVDLKVAFDLFNYDEALAIILMMLALVIAVEQSSGWIRRKLI